MTVSANVVVDREGRLEIRRIDVGHQQVQGVVGLKAYVGVMQAEVTIDCRNQGSDDRHRCPCDRVARGRSTFARHALPPLVGQDPGVVGKRFPGRRVDDREKFHTVPIQLYLTDSADIEHGRQRGGAVLQHFEQG